MMFLVLEARKDYGNKERIMVQAWIRTSCREQARTAAEQQLHIDNCSIIKLIECTSTTRDDYFPPCRSLDAYLEAEQHGIALRYS